MDCTIHIAKTKALISCTVTAQLICVFVFAYAKTRFSHNEAHILTTLEKLFQILYGASMRLGLKISINGPGHISEMATMPIFGKKL